MGLRLRWLRLLLRARAACRREKLSAPRSVPSSGPGPWLFLLLEVRGHAHSIFLISVSIKRRLVACASPPRLGDHRAAPLWRWLSRLYTLRDARLVDRFHFRPRNRDCGAFAPVVPYRFLDTRTRHGDTPRGRDRHQCRRRRRVGLDTGDRILCRRATI